MPEASMTNQDYREIKEVLSSLDTRVAVQAEAAQSQANLTQALTDSIKTFITRDRSIDCPMRVDIARASDNTARIAAAEIGIQAVRSKVHDVELLTVKAATRGGAIGGGGVGVLVLIGYGIAKAIGLA